MEFKDLPMVIQEKAAETLAVSLKGFEGELKSEPAKELARSINAAFVELYEGKLNPICCSHNSVQELDERTAQAIASALIPLIR